MAQIRAWNTRTKQFQVVPESYLTGGPFPGRFVSEKDAPKSQRPKKDAPKSQRPKEDAPKSQRPKGAKNTRRKAGTAETPATDEAANATTSTPPAGDPKKE